jgi:hypothetical protein
MGATRTPNSIADATMQWSVTDDRRCARSRRPLGIHHRRPRACRRIRVIMDIAIQRLIARRRLKLERAIEEQRLAVIADIALRRLIIPVGDFPEVSAAAWAEAVRHRVIQRTAIADLYFSLIYDLGGRS